MNDSVDKFPSRAVGIGLVLVVLLCWVSPYEDLVLQNMIPGGHSAPMLATLFFLVLAGLNVLAGLLARTLTGANGGPARWLSGSDLAIIFCMLLAASGIPSMGLVDYLIPTLVAPFYYADTSNDWAALFHAHIPAWLVPSKDPASPVIQDFVRGGSKVPWAAWLPCLVWWTTFFAALYLATFSLCLLLSDSWIRAERLNFPLMELPMALLGRAERRPWQTSVFWAGVLTPVLVHSWNALTDYKPDLPKVPLGVNLASLLGGTFGAFSAQVYPALMGFFYFVPTSVTCGLWVSFAFMKGQRHLGSRFGTNWFSTGGVWYGSASELYQGMGAMLVLLAGWAWIARESLSQQVAQALKGRSLAFWGLVAGLAYMLLFWALAGLNLAIGLAIFVAYFLIAIALTRLVAQAGLPYVQAAFVPSDLVTSFAGSRVFSLKDFSLLGFQFPLSFDIAGFLMPSVFHGLKVSDRLGLPPRRLLLAMALAILVAMPVAFYSFLTVTYEHGGNSVTSWWYFEGSPKLPFSTFAGMAKAPKTTDLHALSFIGFGGALTAGLVYLLRHFPGWPIHPLGYMLSGTWVIHLSWFSCFLAWCIKSALVRYGGGRAYHAAAPFFLGLILGGFITPGLWALIDMWTGKTGHAISTFPP
ncbi:MAG: hypothetical protein HYU36_10585 [Planctomycetes bacterium]|nr:hypothetical protein [Planctomycetota bacterium]